MVVAPELCGVHEEASCHIRCEACPEPARTIALEHVTNHTTQPNLTLSRALLLRLDDFHRIEANDRESSGETSREEARRVGGRGVGRKESKYGLVHAERQRRVAHLADERSLDALPKGWQTFLYADARDGVDHALVAGSAGGAVDLELQPRLGNVDRQRRHLRHTSSECRGKQAVQHGKNDREKSLGTFTLWAPNINM